MPTFKTYFLATNSFGNPFMCGPNGADGNNESKFVLESDAQALIASKDAELLAIKRELDRVREFARPFVSGYKVGSERHLPELMGE